MKNDQNDSQKCQREIVWIVVAIVIGPFNIPAGLFFSSLLFSGKSNSLWLVIVSVAFDIMVYLFVKYSFKRIKQGRWDE